MRVRLTRGGGGNPTEDRVQVTHGCKKEQQLDMISLYRQSSQIRTSFVIPAPWNLRIFNLGDYIMSSHHPGHAVR